MAGLQYKNQVDIVAGGYPGEWKGTSGVITDWTDVIGTSGSMTCDYYYHDSQIANNAVSSRVWVTISDNWEILETTPDNHIILRVNTVVQRINRQAKGTGAEGSWNSLGTSWDFRWHIQLFRHRGDSSPVSGGDFPNLEANINQLITSNGPVSLGTYTIDLPPQTSVTPDSRGTVFYQNATMGHESDPDTSSYVDRMWMGINFRNTLPPDYRPGQILDNNSMWQSHNRTSGADNIYTGSVWQTMRTSDGAVGQNNPPLIRHTSSWYNERKIGANK